MTKSEEVKGRVLSKLIDDLSQAYLTELAGIPRHLFPDDEGAQELLLEDLCNAFTRGSQNVLAIREKLFLEIKDH
jgi:hypothetical protein